MSTALAIAATTAVLKDLLQNALVADELSSTLGTVAVTAKPPDRVLDGAAEEPTQLNLFLHRTSPNPGWRNLQLPSRDSRGERIASPALALDLHYLLTAYGAKDFYAEMLLGHAMQILHETPVLTRDAIRSALSPTSPPADFPTTLATAGLAEQIEQLRITLEPASTEESSKLWSALQTHLRTSAFYIVTVVLIEARRSARVALPVTTRNAYVRTLQTPRIDAVVSTAGDLAALTPGSTLLVRGAQLRGDSMQLWLNGTDVTSAATTFGLDEIRHPLTPLPSDLRAGIVAVQVVQPIDMGTPEAPHTGFESNVAAFVLRPEIAATVLSSSDTETVDGLMMKEGEIEVTFSPRVGSEQKVTLVLNEKEPPSTRRARAYSFRAEAGNGVVEPAEDTATVTIGFANVAEGTYVVRVQVDGAESLLTVNANGFFDQPEVDI